MHYKRPYDAQMAPNRNAIGSVLVSGAFNRDNMVNYLSDKLYNVVAGITVFNPLLVTLLPKCTILLVT